MAATERLAPTTEQPTETPAPETPAAAAPCVLGRQLHRRAAGQVDSLINERLRRAHTKAAEEKAIAATTLVRGR